MVYKQYWKDEMDKLDEKATDMSSAETLSEDYKLFKKIHDSFDKILEVLKDMKSLVQKDAEASGFDDFISEIKDKA